MKIIATTTFKKSISKIEKNMIKRILGKIDLFYNISENVYDLNLDIKKINPKEKWIYRLRVGKYRVLFTFKDKTIKLLDVDNRDSIYF